MRFEANRYKPNGFRPKAVLFDGGFSCGSYVWTGNSRNVIDDSNFVYYVYCISFSLSWSPVRSGFMAESKKKVSSTNGTSAHSVNGAGTPWTFLTNHAHVLILLHSEPDLVLREVALRVGITERAVQRIVQELEQEGFLRRERVGRRNHYQIASGQFLRHPVESHCSIDQLLAMVAGKRTVRKSKSPKAKAVR